MKKTILFFALGAFIILIAATAYATSLNWSGSGVTGTDPLGHGWEYENDVFDVSIILSS